MSDFSQEQADNVVAGFLSDLAGRAVVRESTESDVHRFDLRPTDVPARFGMHIATLPSAVQVLSYLHPEAPYVDLDPEYDRDVVTQLGESRRVPRRVGNRARGKNPVDVRPRDPFRAEQER